MKRKSIFFGMTLLIAVLMLSIGYAAVNQRLNIYGVAQAMPYETSFDVMFTDAVATDPSKVSVTIDSELAAKMNVSGLTFAGDKVSATFTLANQSPELTAELSEAVVRNNNTEYFKVTVNPVAGDLDPGTDRDVIVTVELIKPSIEVIGGVFTISIDALPKLV